MGISGFFHAEAGASQASSRCVLEAMAANARPTGPARISIWQQPEAGVGLASCWPLDSEASEGASPGGRMLQSRDGCYLLIFDGELYNRAQVQAELAAHGRAPASGDSSGVLLLAALQTWGLQRGLPRLRGSFALVLWDAQLRQLQLVRDRLGEKPLYYGVHSGVLLFGSELQALRQHPAWSGEICRQALTQLLRFGYIPEPHSIYRGIHKLPPGSWLQLSRGLLRQPDAIAPQGPLGPRSYWSLGAVATAGLAAPWEGSVEDAVDTLEQLLQEAVSQQLNANGPTGALLSGGVDSSTVVALMQAHSRQAVRTFTIGFDEAAFNEAHYARAVAAHLGTEHTEHQVSPQDALNLIPRLPQVYDEPFADPSQIPMLFVSRLAQQQVEVALAGDGGDELFAGYSRYVWVDKIWVRRRSMPRPLRLAAAGCMSLMPAPRLDFWFGLLRRLLPLSQLQQQNLGSKVHKLAAALRAEDSTELYRTLMSFWQEPSRLALAAREPASVLDSGSIPTGQLSLIDTLMYWDLLSYLTGDILVKLDRAARHTGLQLRLPLLDQQLVEFAWRIPIDLKLRDGQGKWLLRQVACRYLPRELLERPKMGFSPPIASWLRGPLREWAEELLQPDRLAQQGLLEPQLVRRTWEAHQVGRQDAALPMWSVLMFQAWYDEQQQRLSPALAERAIREQLQPVLAEGAVLSPVG